MLSKGLGVIESITVILCSFDVISAEILNVWTRGPKLAVDKKLPFYKTKLLWDVIYIIVMYL